MPLQTKDLTLTYSAAAKNGKGPSSAVLTGASIEIERGEVFVLQGPNGSGKSTLMKALARQLRPTSGIVTLDGLDIWQMGIQQFAQKIAYVPQTLRAPPSMTVRELVALGRSPHQKLFQLSLSDKDKDMVQAALTRCAVEGLQDKLVAELSCGERQRTVIAMALSQGPDYLLLDEPTASLDFRYQLELISLLGQLKGEGLGIGLILHDLNIAAQLADKVALLASETGSPSAIIAQGKIEDVFARETLKRVFSVDIEILRGGGKNIYLPTRLEGIAVALDEDRRSGAKV
jgi:ABC-type cobalamin/Fe3+-siderophores transport system ATPase subunit